MNSTKRALMIGTLVWTTILLTPMLGRAQNNQLHDIVSKGKNRLVIRRAQ